MEVLFVCHCLECGVTPLGVVVDRGPMLPVSWLKLQTPTFEYGALLEDLEGLFHL